MRGRRLEEWAARDWRRRRRIEYDARDDSFRRMEVNARTVSGNHLAVDAGVDLPYISYTDGARRMISR